MRSLLRTSLLALAFIFVHSVATIALFAQTSTGSIPPTGLSSRVSAIVTSNGRVTFEVTLSWNYRSTTNTVPTFAIFQANAQTEDMTQFRRIATITRRVDSLRYTITGLETGPYTFYVTAILPDGTQSLRSNVSSVFALTPTPPAPAVTCATINGRVLYTDGTAVTGATVIATPFNIRLTGNSFTPVLPASTEVGADGSYSMRVAASTFIVSVVGRNVPTTFSPGTTNLENATRVVVACNQTSTANISVVRPRVPVSYTVSGRVTVRNSGGIPVPNAIITFIPRSQSRPNERIGISTAIGLASGLAVRTDAQGNFTTRLTDEFIYSAMASSAPGGTEYEQQWFRMASNPNEATPITLTANRSDITFELTPRRVFNNGLGGTVRGVDGNATTAIVSAIRVASTGDTVRTAFTRTTESTVRGEWRVTNLLPGNYVLFAAPREPGSRLAPGYYRVATTATNQWDNATRIAVGDVMPTVLYSIVLPLRSNQQGIGRINGSVNESPAGALASTSPLAGAFVTVLDDDGSVVDYGFSDGTGEFSLSELTDGTYRIVAEKVNYRPVERSVTVDYAQAQTSMQLDLRNDGTLTSITPTVVNNALTISPNPAQQTAYISVPTSLQTTIGQTSRISVVNMLGQEVLNITVQGNIGTLPIDVSTLAPGAYFVRIQGTTTMLHGRLTITR